jgi:hypothetical protein
MCNTGNISDFTLTMNFNGDLISFFYSFQWNRAKVEVALISCGTQTDWERDVQADSDLKIPMASASMCEDSFLSSLNHSREDESCDVTWEPSDDEDDDDDDSDDDQMEWEGSQSQITGRKFIVSESCLDKLLNKCSICNKPVVVNKTVKGCLLVCSRICDNCNETQTWESQPTICGLAEGHLDLSAAIMFSGSATAKFLRALRFAGISCFNDSTFYNIQKHYLSPSVEHVWKEHQTQLTSEIRDKGLPIVIGGDGRCCSPGHTAKYGTYSVMDLNSGKILDIQLVQVCLFNSIYLSVVNQYLLQVFITLHTKHLRLIYQTSFFFYER